VRLLLVALLALSATAWADKPVVSVLEYRAGARALPGIGDRLAKLLGSSASVKAVSPADARRRLGPKVDADVARCGGEAMCIGAIGEQLGADEVVLIGISQLGDVVLAIQRIDARRGRMLSRLTESLSADNEVITDEQMLGWLKQLFPPELFKRYGAIRILADVADAEVMLNDELRGQTPVAEPLRVRAPAMYRVKLTKPGFAPFQAGIDVIPDATVEVRATLVRLNRELPWFKRWYVWLTVGAVVAAAGVAVGVYYGTRVDETPMGFISAPKPAALGFRF